jgi:hypothetical protein
MQHAHRKISPLLYALDIIINEMMQKMHKKLDPTDHHRSYLHFLRWLLLRQKHWVLA